MTKSLTVLGLAGCLAVAPPAGAQSPPPPPGGAEGSHLDQCFAFPVSSLGKRGEFKSLIEVGALTVRGNATVEQKPDLAELTVSVLTRGPTLDGTARDHAARVARAGTALAHLGPEGASIDQGSFSLTEERPPVAPGVQPGKEPATYRAETRYALTVEALDRLDAIVGAIVSAGLFEVGSARFAVRDEGDAIDRARRAAMADARHQADVYADAGGVRLDGIEQITDGDAAGRDGAYDLPLRVARSASVGLTPPKTLKFQGSVAVTWRIAPR